MKDSKMVARIVYWANDGADWREIANAAGYRIDEQPILGNTTEYRLSRDGEVRAVLARVDGELYGFVWVAEARHWRDRIRYAVLRTAPA